MEHQGFPFVFSFSRLLSHHVADDSMEKRKRNFFFVDGPHFADPASDGKSSKFKNSQRKSILTQNAIWVINNRDQAKVIRKILSVSDFIKFVFFRVCGQQLKIIYFLLSSLPSASSLLLIQLAILIFSLLLFFFIFATCSLRAMS